MSAILLRAASRFSVRRKICIPCQVVTEDDFRLVGDLCTDLSTTGLRVRAARLARAGAPVLVSFRIPDSDVWLDTEGVISRVLWGRRGADDCPAFGVRFTPLPRIEAAVLAARLRGLPPPVPDRALRVDYAESVRRIAVAA